jgi:peroxiredoxin
VSRCFIAILVLCGAASFAADAYTLGGSVYNEEGEPVPGAQVWLIQARQARSTTTGEAGQFRFEDAAWKPADLVAVKNGFAHGGLGVYVTGDVLDMRLVMEPEPRVQTVRVIGPDRRPLEGARALHLVINEAYHVPLAEMYEAGFPDMRSDAEGMLALTGLPAEAVSVSFVVGHRRHAPEAIQSLPLSDEVRTVQLSRGEVLRGRVATEEGSAIEGASVAAVPVDAASLAPPQETATDRDGFYSLLVRTGDYAVAAKAPGYAKGVASVQVRKLGDNLCDVQLAVGHEISGSVTGPDEEPMEGVWVEYLFEGAVYDRVRTNVGGRFVFEAPAGRGTIRVRPPDGYTLGQRLNPEVVVEEEHQISVGDIPLVQLPSIEGVLHMPDGSPAGDVLLSAVNVDPPLWTVTDAQGRFALRLVRTPEPDKETTAPSVKIAAEHPLRFLRAAFSAELPDPASIQHKLQLYDPPAADERHVGLNTGGEELLGEAAPAFEGESWLNAEPLYLDELKGRVVVLFFWSGLADFGPPRDMLEYMRALHHVYRDVEDVAVIGVHDGSMEEDEAERAVRQYGVQFPVLHDTLEGSTFSRYGVQYLPEVVLIDKAGAVRFYGLHEDLPVYVKLLRREE